MLILGKTGDDKGTQLEQFTCEVLKRLGYVNITTNEVRSGAEELDVTGEYHIPHPGSSQVVRLISECKAYKNPIDLPVWHKFLGKFYSEFVRTGNQPFGVLIALSGANGNCMGAYKDFQTHSDRIRLLASDDLLTLLRQMYSLAEEKEIARFISARTTRTTIEMDIAYYAAEAYWMIRFNDGMFTLLGGDGSALDSSKAIQLAEMVTNAIGGTFIDLSVEAKAKQEELQARSSIIAELLLSGLSIELSSLKGLLKCDPTQLQKALSELEEEGAIQSDNQVIALSEIFDRANLLRILFANGIRPELLSTPGYKALFNASLMDSVVAVQGGIALTDDEREKLLYLMSVSPNAARAIVSPIQMIVQHRNNAHPIDDEMNSLDVEVLFEQAFGLLHHDFHVREFGQYLLREANIAEIDRSVRLVLKSKQSIKMEHNFRSRIRKAEFETIDPITGCHPIITVRCRNDLAEPWEPPFVEGDTTLLDSNTGKDPTHHEPAS